MNRLRIVREDGWTRVYRADSGEEIEHVTSLEIYQTDPAIMFAVVKIVGTVDQIDVDARADLIKDGHAVD